MGQGDASGLASKSRPAHLQGRLKRVVTVWRERGGGRA